MTVSQEIEAESGALTPPMQVGGETPDLFVHVPAGSLDYHGAMAEFRLRVTEAGSHHIWARVSATSASDDSFLVRVLGPDGGPIPVGRDDGWAHFRLECAAPPYRHGSFAWTRVGHWNPYVTPPEEITPVTYDLAAGIYTIQVAPRELGTRLDRIRVDRR